MGRSTKQRMSVRTKLITLFIIIKVIPLVLLALIAWKQSLGLSKELNRSLEETKKITIESTTNALTDLARENVERLSTDLALDIAEFLYARDANISHVSIIPPSFENYTYFLNSMTTRLPTQTQWSMDENDISKDASWKPVEKKQQGKILKSSNSQNDLHFNYRPMDAFTYKTVPFFQEITFIDLDGQELIKATSSPLMDKELKDVSKRENTFIKAETYFQFLPDLKEGEIYISDVVGSYKPSEIVGIYNKFNAEKTGVEYDPENATYAGWENPVGKRFKGIIRWATPVFKNGEKIGYVTLALDHDHLLSLVDSATPTRERYIEFPNAYHGNYLFLFDHNAKNIGHPRHYYIVGHDPETGDIAMPSLEQSIYDKWLTSGKSYVDFIVDEPTFVDQNRSKRPAPALSKKGSTAIDCRYSNFAPQCIGWVDLTKEGGSGSFIIEWDGLSKLTTAAAIPYYTGNYAHKKTGFGFVTATVNLGEFLSPVVKTTNKIEQLITKSNEEIDNSLLNIAYSLIFSTLVMTLIVIAIAIWLASTLTKRITFINNGILKFRNGERLFRFNEPVQDEIGILCKSFDFMADSIDENTINIFIITDLDSTILYANDLAVSSLGRTRDTVFGRNYEDISTLGKSNPLTRHRNQLPERVQQHPITKEYHKSTVENFYNDEQEHIGYFITVEDVTFIISQQREIDFQRHLLLTIFTSSPTIMWYKNAQKQYLAVNPRFCSIVGKESDDVVNRYASDILPKSVLFDDTIYDSQTQEIQGPVYSEEKYFFYDGHYELLDVVRTPVYDKNNDFMGIVGIAHNISELITNEVRLKEIQAGLEKAVLDANQANTAKNDFLTRMSHEIRTPMNAIIGMSTIAKDKLTNPKISHEEMRTYISQIDISAKHLLSLVNEILETVKIDKATLTLRKNVFEIDKLFKEALSILAASCSTTEVKINLDIPNLENQLFISDSTRICQTLLTLLSNAVEQAAPKGTVSFKISYEQAENNEVRFGFTIHDDGAPMSQLKIDAIENAVEKNAILLNTKIDSDDNFSLSLCQQVITLLGGTIKVQSSISGNTLTFNFLLKQVEGKKTEESCDLQTLQGRRVLLVDDIQINRIILKALLTNIKVEIEEADDGSTALDMFVNSPVGYYDMIFMDIQMPKMNGFEATAAIRHLDRADAQTVPILAITANSFQEDIQKSLECGMNAHFPKPVDRDRLFMTMLQFLKR